MEPKLKAIELFEKFNKPDTTHYPYVHNAQQCALIAVDELIKSHLLLTTTHEAEPSIRCKTYWQEVKQEINNL
jgi:hypothetical protein